METCTECGSWFVTGEACEVCGHTVQPVQADAPAPASDPRTRQPAPDPVEVPIPAPAPPVVGIPQVEPSGDHRQHILIGLAAMCAALVVIISFVLVSLDSDDEPDTLATVDDPNATDFSIAIDSFCENPRPLADAPKPNAEGANLFATFEKLGALPWQRGLTAGMFDETYFSEEYPKLRLTTVAPTEPSYALCLSGLGNGQDRICADYGTGGQFEIFGATWNMSLYELASGEELLSKVPVRSEISVCPDIRPDLSRNQGPRAEHVRLFAASYALPRDYTSMHLEHDLDFGSTDWCDSPRRVAGVGERAAKPAAFLLTNGSQALATAGAQIKTSTKDVALVTHVACLGFESDPQERQSRCRFEGENLVKFNRGTYTVTLINAATGGLVDQRSFDADVSCPSVFDFAHVRVHTLRGRFPTSAAVWIDSVLTEPEEEEEEDSAEEDGKPGQDSQERPGDEAEVEDGEDPED